VKIEGDIIKENRGDCQEKEGSVLVLKDKVDG
jgi:hypothetical protein